MSARKVLAGVDGSANSYTALDVAMAEARARDAGLRVVTAYSIPAIARGKVGARYEEATRDASADVLDEAVAYARDQGVEAEPVLLAGDAAGALVDQSADAEVVAVGARGQGGFPGRLLGSVASGLPAHADCPVIVVPRTGVAEEYSATASYKERIVVGVDSVGVDHPALMAAADAAKYHGMPLAVIAAASVEVSGFEVSPSPFEQPEVHGRIQPTLDACIAEVRRSHPDVEVHSRIHDGLAANVLVDVSATAYRLVVGTRGRGGLASVLMGSTSRGLLHYALGPVMAVRR